MTLAEIRQPDDAGRVVLLVRGRRCILPLGVRAIDMPSWLERLVGRLTPAATYRQTIRFNGDVLAPLSLETVVHECVHVFQERRMGKVAYGATYAWQCLVSLFRAGPMHIHDDHLMEQEARWAARTACASLPSGDLDVAAEIAFVTGWTL